MQSSWCGALNLLIHALVVLLTARAKLIVMEVSANMEDLNEEWDTRLMDTFSDIEDILSELVKKSGGFLGRGTKFSGLDSELCSLPAVRSELER